MTTPTASPRLITANRKQLLLRSIDVEKLIPDDHPARAIWEFVGRCDLASYEEKIKSVEGGAGRPAYDPRLLISLWVYAYSDGVGSAREIERQCGHDPAYMWITGMEEINHHTISDFRIDHAKELDGLFTQVLGILSAEKLITLRRVMHDGTKVKAYASSKSFRREDTIREHMEMAEQHIREMGDPRAEGVSPRVAAAKKRVVEERKQQMDLAMKELEKIQAARDKSDRERKEARVSETDPEARIMKQAGGGFAPSYNVQLSTDAAAGIIVAVDVSQSGTDAHELVPAIRQIEERRGESPEQLVVDGGYTTRSNIMEMHEREIDLIGSMPDNAGTSAAKYDRQGVAPEFRIAAFVHDEAADTMTCPAGVALRRVGQIKRVGMMEHHYKSEADVCKACAFQKKCCPSMSPTRRYGRMVVRIVENPAVAAFRKKMETPESKEIYKQRAQVAEFPNAWIKEKLNMRQFRTRGRKKTMQEALWGTITYNIQQWIRLIWRPQLAPSTG